MLESMMQRAMIYCREGSEESEHGGGKEREIERERELINSRQEGKRRT